MNLVIDASALVEVLLLSPRGRRVGGLLFAQGTGLCAPELLEIEAMQVLRRAERSGELSELRARQAFEDLGNLRIQRYPHPPLRQRIWALRHGLSAYDATYVALAEALEAPLVTCDGQLARGSGDPRIMLVE